MPWSLCIHPELANGFVLGESVNTLGPERRIGLLSMTSHAPSSVILGATVNEYGVI